MKTACFIHMQWVKMGSWRVPYKIQYCGGQRGDCGQPEKFIKISII